MPEQVDKKKITKNAGALYLRTLFSTVVSLYTSRVVLDTLGVNDFGVYTLVGGIVSIFSVLNGSLSGATSRFLTFEIGRDDAERKKLTFSSALMLHIAVAAIVLLLAETIGLWFVNNKLVIAPERMTAANWVYQFSILATLVGITQIPYNACIFAHERFKFYATMSIVNVLMKLAIVLILLWVPSADNLILYAFLTLVIQLLGMIIYRIYCVRNFPEARFSLSFRRDIIVPMATFSFWNLFGSFGFSLRLQGSNVILNRFGGTAVNAASSIAMTVSGTLSGFASTVIAAFRPQIIKQFAAGNIRAMSDLMDNASRFSLMLFGVFAVPLAIEMPYVLALWLKDVPAHTVAFCRITLLACIAELLYYIVSIGVQATGKISRASIITGVLYILELPLMYLLIKLSGNPNFAFWVHVLFMSVIMVVNVWLLKSLIGSAFAAGSFMLRSVAVPLGAIVCVAVVTFLLITHFHESFVRLVATCAVSTLLLAVVSYVSLNESQRQSVRTFIMSKISRK